MLDAQDCLETRGGARARRRRLDLGGDLDSTSAGLERLAQPDLGQAGATPAVQFHAQPEPDIGQFGAPVPAEVVRSLAHIWRSRQLIVGTGQVADRVQPCGLKNRRPERYVELVAAGAESAADIPAPGPEHVVGAAERLAVEPDICERAEACEDDLHAPGGGERLIYHETADVLPVALGHPLNPDLLVAEERVWNSAGGHQVQVDASGDGGRQPLGSAALPHKPAVVESLFGHPSPRGRRSAPS